MSTITEKRESFLFEGEFYPGYSFSVRTREPANWSAVTRGHLALGGAEVVHPEMYGTIVRRGWLAYPDYGLRACAGEVPSYGEPDDLVPDLPPLGKSLWCLGWSIHQDQLTQRMVRLRAETDQLRAFMERKAGRPDAITDDGGR